MQGLHGYAFSLKCAYLVVESFAVGVVITADMFEIVNEAILIHPLSRIG